jgi:hypothetical protein
MTVCCFGRFPNREPKLIRLVANVSEWSVEPRTPRLNTSLLRFQRAFIERIVGILFSTFLELDTALPETDYRLHDVGSAVGTNASGSIDQR